MFSPVNLGIECKQNVHLNAEKTTIKHFTTTPYHSEFEMKRTTAYHGGFTPDQPNLPVEKQTQKQILPTYFSNKL